MAEYIFFIENNIDSLIINITYMYTIMEIVHSITKRTFNIYGSLSACYENRCYFRSANVFCLNEMSNKCPSGHLAAPIKFLHCRC